MVKIVLVRYLDDKLNAQVASCDLFLSCAIGNEFALSPCRTRPGDRRVPGYPGSEVMDIPQRRASGSSAAQQDQPEVENSLKIYRQVGKSPNSYFCRGIPACRLKFCSS